jgi:hypothetical protein
MHFFLTLRAGVMQRYLSTALKLKASSARPKISGVRTRFFRSG